MSEGDVVVLAEKSKGAVAKGMDGTILGASGEAVFSSNNSKITYLPDDAQQFTLGKNGNYWTLNNDEGQKLGCTAVKKLSWSASANKWTIDINNGAATIQNSNSDYGRFLYNVGTPRFTTYTSKTSASMILPQLYRGKAAPKVYATSIEISGAEEVNVNATAQLGVTFTPSDTSVTTVTWSSSDTSVATVSSSGLVTGKKAGTVTITAKVPAENGGYITDTHTIQVKAVEVTGISLNASAKEVGVNLTTTLTATISPSNATNKTVAWTSSDPSVATVSGGTVKGVSEGTATITATSSNGLTATCVVTVIYTHVTSVSLSETAKEVGMGRTITLTATVSPSNATNKSVTWNSDDESIAKVSSAGVVTGVALGTTNITVTSVDGGYTATCAVTVTEVSLDAWTVLVYISGNDLESDSQGGYATADIKEMCSVANQPDDVNVVIQTGGASSWKSTYGIASNKLGRYHVRNKSLVKDAELANASMGSPDTLQSFLEWGMDAYPAEKTALIFWNHGGALDGVCYDENYGDDPLTSSEVTSAIQGAFNTLGRTDKLEFIGYDACLMQVQDIAIANAPYANYMVGSQESEAGEGWEYSTWLDDLYDGKDTETVLKAIADGFLDSYMDNYGAQYDNDQTLSFLDLSYAQAYLEAFEALAAEINGKLTSTTKTTLLNLLKDCKTFGDYWMDRSEYQSYIQMGYDSSWFTTEREDGVTYYCLPGSYSYGTIDVYDFLNKLEANTTFNSSKIAEVKQAFDNLVVYNTVGNEAGEAHGLTMIFEPSDYEIYHDDEATFPTWHSVVLALNK